VRYRFATFATALAIGMGVLIAWLLWLSAEGLPHNVFLVATRQLAKDLALPLAILIAGGWLAQRSSQIVQTRTALLPLVYQQARSAWYPIILRLYKVLEYDIRRAEDHEAMPRCFFHLLLLMRSLESAARNYGFIHLSSEQAEEVIFRAERFMYTWCLHILGRSNFEEALEIMTDAHMSYPRFQHESANSAEVHAARDQFALQFSPSSPAMRLLLAASALFSAVLQTELTRIVKLWYSKQVFESPGFNVALAQVDHLADENDAILQREARDLAAAARAYVNAK
jgi:hypothetical protein